MGWTYWLGSVTLAPVETEATLQYADRYVNQGLGFHVVHQAHGQTVLTAAGYAVAAVLMFASLPSTSTAPGVSAGRTRRSSGGRSRSPR